MEQNCFFFFLFPLIPDGSLYNAITASAAGHYIIPLGRQGLLCVPSFQGGQVVGGQQILMSFSCGAFVEIAFFPLRFVFSVFPNTFTRRAVPSFGKARLPLRTIFSRSIGSRRIVYVNVIFFWVFRRDGFFPFPFEFSLSPNTFKRRSRNRIIKVIFHIQN